MNFSYFGIDESLSDGVCALQSLTKLREIENPFLLEPRQILATCETDQIYDICSCAEGSQPRRHVDVR